MEFVPTPNPARDQIIRNGTITDGVSITVTNRSAHNGKAFQADSYRIRFIAHHGKWICAGVQIFGGLFKKDGTPGNVKAEQDFTDLTSTSTPPWVRSLVSYVTPEESAHSVNEEPLALQL